MPNFKRVDTTRNACIEMFCGSSGSGKSYKVKSKIKKEKRLIIFDPDDEYGEIRGIKTVRTGQQLLNAVIKAKNAPLKVRFVANGADNFDVWAKAVFSWGNCVCVAEEIAGVTSPSKAPKGWHSLISRGRKRGITIYAVTQRPSESDKTILGNISSLWCGRLARFKDRKYLSDELDVKVQDVTELKALDYLERNMITGEIYRGNSKGNWKKTLEEHRKQQQKP